jgi:hypothetical protein
MSRPSESQLSTADFGLDIDQWVMQLKRYFNRYGKKSVAFF